MRPDYKNWMPLWMNCFSASITTTLSFGTAESLKASKKNKSVLLNTAAFVHLPEDGIGFDIGCGNGALTIACAKANPQADRIGIDTWKKEYDSFSRKLCERNAKAEHIENACFPA